MSFNRAKTIKLEGVDGLNSLRYCCLCDKTPTRVARVTEKTCTKKSPTKIAQMNCLEDLYERFTHKIALKGSFVEDAHKDHVQKLLKKVAYETSLGYQLRYILFEDCLPIRSHLNAAL